MFVMGRAIAEAVSLWLPTAVARVRAWVWQVEFVVDKVASGKFFLRVLRFPLPKPFIPPTSPSSSSQLPGAVIRGLATSSSPIQGDLPTVLDLVTEAGLARNLAVEQQGEKKRIFVMGIVKNTNLIR
jgi:hypothetical protein